MSTETTKDLVIEMIRQMPSDATVADIMAELYFRQKVDEGLRQLDEGQGIDHEDAKKRLAPWVR
jgi:predicted transcriptional regulator